MPLQARRETALSRSAEERSRRPQGSSADPLSQAVTRTTSAHVPATKMAMSANAPAKPAPIAAQSRPGDSVLTARRSRSGSLPSKSPSLNFPLNRFDNRVACLFPGRGSAQTSRPANHSVEGLRLRCTCFARPCGLMEGAPRPERDRSRGSPPAVRKRTRSVRTATDRPPSAFPLGCTHAFAASKPSRGGEPSTAPSAAEGQASLARRMLSTRARRVTESRVARPAANGTYGRDSRRTRGARER
jgi:hypothetical protein